MHTRTLYSLPERLDIDTIGSIIRKLGYSLPNIQGCGYDKSKHSIYVDSAASDKSTYAQVLARIIEVESRNRPLPKRVIRRSHSTDSAPIFSASRIEAIDQCANAFHEIQTTLVRQITQKLGLRTSAARHFPSLIRSEDLERCDYLRSFPQNAYLVFAYTHDFDLLNSIATHAEAVELLARPASFVLAPAVCFHCYAELAGSTINENIIVSASGRCFRHEPAWRIGGHRQREFLMHEIVCVGDAEFVELQRMRIMDAAWEIFTALGFTGDIESAHDPFYFPSDAAKAQYQLLATTKFELVCRLDDYPEEFALASFNNMGTSLCRKYRIANKGGQPAYSSCSAFGLDRWALAIMGRHGADAINRLQQI